METLPIEASPEGSSTLWQNVHVMRHSCMQLVMLGLLWRSPQLSEMFPAAAFALAPPSGWTLDWQPLWTRLVVSGRCGNVFGTQWHAMPSKNNSRPFQDPIRFCKWKRRESYWYGGAWRRWRHCWGGCQWQWWLGRPSTWDGGYGRLRPPETLRTRRLFGGGQVWNPSISDTFLSMCRFSIRRITIFGPWPLAIHLQEN